MIANSAIEMKQMLEGVIDHSYQYCMETNNNQGSNAEVGNNVAFDIVKSLASVECSEKEAEIDGVEEGNVQHMIS